MEEVAQSETSCGLVGGLAGALIVFQQVDDGRTAQVVVAACAVLPARIHDVCDADLGQEK